MDFRRSAGRLPTGVDSKGRQLFGWHFAGRLPLDLEESPMLSLVDRRVRAYNLAAAVRAAGYRCWLAQYHWANAPRLPRVRRLEVCRA